MTKTVLLVDYDPASIDAIRRFLSRLDVRIVLATDGLAGEREFFRMVPDLTLIQEVIPKKRGIDLCRDIKSSPSGARRPVLLLVSTRNGGRSAKISSGCDDCIEKPFDEATLVAKVRRFLPESPQPGTRYA